MEGYTVLRELGRGKRATVHHVRHDATGVEYCLKAGGDASGKEAERYAALAPSPHFLRCYNAVPLLLEWCPGDDLFSLHGRCDEVTARGYIRQALCCLDKCGQRPHGDIKLENFLLGPDGVLKLIDFGPSGGSKNYLAPEMLKQSPPRTSLEGDLYAIGVCLYVLMAGVYPFFHLSEATWFKNVIRGTCAPLPATRALSAQGTQFMSWCLSPDPKQRPRDATEAMGHGWFETTAAGTTACCGMFILFVFVVASHAQSTCSGTINKNPFATGAPRFVSKVANGSRWIVGAGNDTIHVVHVYGAPYDMGYAYGTLFKYEINDMIPLFYDWVNAQIDGFCQKSIPSLEWLCKIIEQGHTVDIALDLTIALTAKYTPAWYTDELRGMADASGANYTTLMRLNMFPELIRAACTMSGSWGAAVPSGLGVHQLRALDEGTDGPMAKYPLLTVYHPDANGAMGQSYVNVGWVCLTGVLTGYSEARMGLSEKVNDGYNGSFAMAGIPWMVEMKAIMMFDKTVVDGIARMQNAERTCAIHIGLGAPSVDEATSYEFRGMEYSHDVIKVYDDKNWTDTTAHPHLDGVFYWDKHVQPSGDPCLGWLLSSYHGNLTAETYATVIAPMATTGDLQVATWDMQNNIMYTSNAAYGAESGPIDAWNRQFVKVDMTALFATKQN